MRPAGRRIGSPTAPKYQTDPSSPPGTLLVTGAGEGWIRVNADEHRSNVILTPDAVIAGRASSDFDALAPGDFAALLAHPRLTRSLNDAQVGIETMDTRAACRTFNILTGEGRRVVAALIVGEWGTGKREWGMGIYR